MIMSVSLSETRPVGSSHLAEWRKQARRGLIEWLDRKRGRKPNDPLMAEIEKLK